MPIINQVVKGGGGSSATKYGATADAFLGDVDANGVLQSPSEPTDLTFTGVRSVASYDANNGVLFRRFQNLPNIRNVVFPDLETLNVRSAMQNAFYNSGITSFAAPKLSNASGLSCLSYAFYGCKNLVSANLGAISQVGDQSLTYCFQDCSNLENLDLSSLEHTYSGNSSCASLCYRCSKLKTMKFQSLKDISIGGLNSAFAYCTALTDIYFYALEDFKADNAFYNMLTGVSGCTLHFPISFNPTTYTVAQLSTYPNFGGTNTAIAYDIVTSLTGADSNTYTRSEKNSTSTATAWSYNDTLYYTSGTTEPTVGDTIYSDAACTQSVTTITAIA